jgi:cation transport regulator
MPYRTNADLPHRSATTFRRMRRTFIVRRSTIFAAHAGDIRQEEIAHRTAWAAVKRSYVKDDDRWVPIE